MIHSTADIDFNKVTPKGFENLCYDLLVRYNYFNLIWREGGADNGRDIQGTLLFDNVFKSNETKWFFECKRFTSGGVAPNDLTSKITWADAERPDYLVFFISSYLTNNCRVWLDKITPQKQYKIIVIEGEDLKNRIIKFSGLVERYFSVNRYLQLFKEIQNYQSKFNIRPSFEFLKEIIENIDFKKLSIEEIGFLAINFFKDFQLFESRNDYLGDFDGKIINRLLGYLKSIVVNTELTSFDEFKDNYSLLSGSGMIDEADCIDNADYKVREYCYQYYELHLNHKQARTRWKVGEYLVVLYDDVAFEIFKDEETEISIIRNFTDDNIVDLSPRLSNDEIMDYKNYRQYLKSTEG